MDWKETLINVVNKVIDWATTAGVKLLIALVVMFISFKIINAISRRIQKKGENGKFDKTLSRTLAYVLKIGLKILVAICLVGYVGIDTSGLAALVASFGVCIGLAVNGAVSNLAGGVLLIVTRPFKVDDYIEAQGYSGTVEDIHMTNTKIRTPDNKVVYIPNGALSSGNIVNYSEKELRRVDFTFTIAYEADYSKAVKILTDICNAHELVLREPAEPMVRMSAHGDSAVEIATRVWTNNGDYWTVYFDILESVKAAFEKENIEIPYNKLDVNVKTVQ